MNEIGFISRTTQLQRKELYKYIMQVLLATL